jgi:hypothetical protein
MGGNYYSIGIPRCEENALKQAEYIDKDSVLSHKWMSLVRGQIE